MAATIPELPAGTLIADRYRVEQSLGRGAMGGVFAVLDEWVGERVALKLLATRDASSVERFTHELRLARRVTHKNIGRTFDIGQGTLGRFITMERVVGESLRALLTRRGRLPPDETGALMAQACAGVAAAHEAGVIHRDLKPGNVLLEVGGRVVVIDFGIAAPQHHRIDGEGFVSGTYDYMSPEQVLAAAAQPSDDVYALGLIAFELATASRPFAGPDARARAAARVTALPDLGALSPFPALERVIAGCLERDASRRPSAAELERRFASLVGDVDTTDLAPAPSAASAAQPGDAPTTRGSTASRFVSLFVQPLEISGPDEAFGLGASLAEEIGDALGRAPGTRVLSAAWVGDSARASFSELAARGVDFVVSGTVLRQGDAGTSVAVRMTSTASGVRTWSEHFDVGPSQWAGVGSQVAQRIAETLRLALEHVGWGESLPAGAAMAFLEGRRLARTVNVSPPLAVAALDRCLELAPDFAPALATRAVAAVSSYTTADRTGKDWSVDCRAAVGRALEAAPDLPDTHTAAALLSMTACDYVEAVRSLRRVLEIAPTHAFAHEVLGRLECEAGRAERGIARLTLAVDLDPLRRSALVPVARAHALRGRLADFDAVYARLDALDGDATTEECNLMARVAVWFADRQLAERTLRRLPPDPGNRGGSLRFARLLASLATSSDATWELRELQARTHARPIPRRFHVNAYQSGAEAEAARGDPLRGLQNLELADQGGLADVEWLERCPALDVLRDEPRFDAVRARTRARAAAIWTDEHGLEPLSLRR
ncbi:MAG: protein kinase [Polyangiaceae bacterium]|nr:protein kinase [Polyangiaceae bacterium]